MQTCSIDGVIWQAKAIDADFLNELQGSVLLGTRYDTDENGKLQFQQDGLVAHYHYDVRAWRESLKGRLDEGAP